MILADFVSEQAKKSPSRVALIHRDKEITYSQLETSILKCAAGLEKVGVKGGSAFGILLRNSPEFVITSMALAKLGAVMVPINFLEKPDRIALILNDAKAVGVLTQKEFFRHVATAIKTVPTIKHVVLREGEHRECRSFESLMTEAPWKGPVKTKEDDLMMLLYTSGTTGLPKGVMLSHRNFIANVQQCCAGMELLRSDRFLCLLPLFHSFSWTTCLLIPLSLGAVVVLIESLLPFDPVIGAIWKHKVTLFVAVPQIYSALTSKIKGAKAFVLRFLNPVRACISGAAPLTAGIHSNFEKTFGIPLVEGYGLTEASPVVTLNPLKKRKVGTVGRALPGIELEIHDDEGRLLGESEVGEIWVRGPNVMSGYYNRPKETKDVLTKDGWLKTGDMGRLDKEGYVTIVDRKKDLIIVKGLNVYPQEVEAVISRHDSVREVAVVGKMDKETGEELIRAFITLRDGKKIEKSEIFTLCRNELAPYKRPREVIILDEMPKNALQKILKKDLRERP